MDSRAKFLGHALHQQLVPFALGPLFVGVVFDVIRLVSGNGYWSEIAYWMIAAGLVGGLVAAPFGTLDWTKIPSGTRAKRVGALHGIGNVVVVLLSLWNWYRRYEAGEAAVLPTGLVISLVVVLILLYTGWRGWEMVYRHRVAVYDEPR